MAGFLFLLRPGPRMLRTLPPLPDKEIDLMEPVASDDEDTMTDEYREDEKDDPNFGSDVIPIHKICDQPEINVEVPPSYCCTLKAKPVSNEEKNEELSSYKLEKIRKKSESLGTRDMSEMFKIEGDFDLDEEFKVMVKFDNDESSQYLDFFAVVKSDNTWFQIPAQIKTTKMTLNSESDKIYQHKSDPKIMVEFQMGSVDKQTPISITVLPVIPKQLETLRNDFETSIIKNMSPIITVSQPDKSNFNKPIRCTLPCNPLTSSDERKILMVKLDLDGQVDVFELKTKDNDNGTCSFEANNINMCSIVQTTQSISEDKCTRNQIRDEVLYVVGEAKRCILQTFWHKNERLIRTEIIQKSNKLNVQEKMEKEGFRRVESSSKVITLRKGQRIRVDLTGRIKKLQTQKKYGLFVVFQPNLDTKCMEFGFEIKKEFGTSLHGEIRYSSDNYDKVLIDTVHFDPSKKDRLLNILHVSAPTEDIESCERQAISRQGSKFSLFEKCPQNTKSTSPLQRYPVKPQQADDIHGQVNQRSPRSKKANDVPKKTRQSMLVAVNSKNPQYRGKYSRPQTAKDAVRKNLQIQRSKSDVCAKAKVSSPSENAEMNMTSPLQTEVDVYMKTKLRDL